MDRSVRGADSVVPVLRSFAVRGVVEGFYGTPWSHDARLEVMSFLAGHGMNAYAYAPKDDARHRAEWREPYDPGDVEHFRELAAEGGRLGVRFGFAISPGLDIDYESPDDRGVLVRKLAPLREAGVSWFLLLLDDIPMQPGLAPRQAALVSWLHGALGRADLTMCPTEYVGTHPSPYLSDLGAGMPPEVDVMWTGPTVCSPELRAVDARGWTKALGDRRVVVWDNYPVNDALMTASLHLGPYQGRDADLVDVVGGVLCNPMTQARASQIALGTAMDFLAGPDAYDASASWSHVINEVGGERADALSTLARACCDSPISQPETLDLAVRVEALARALDGEDWIGPVRELRAELDRARAVSDAFPDASSGDDPLAVEIGPWAGAARRAAEAGLASLRLIQASRPVALVDSDGRGRAAPPDPEPAMHAAFMVLYVWKGVRAEERVVFGPRFAIYTPVVQMADGSPALDAAAALREDANAIDALCRLSLRAYDTWRTGAAGRSLTVEVDGDSRPIGADGTFEARGGVVLVRQGSAGSRLDAGLALPFSDRRLA
jgi:hyaluronoglucosaminidase